MRVCVVVLGDLGRSPRMLNHAQSLAAQGADVDLIGYGGSVPHRVLREPRICCWFLKTPPELPAAPRRFLAAGLRRAAVQSLELLRMLLVSVPKPDAILVQTPPAVPTLAVARLAARRRSARLVVDWHNLACSMLALRLGERHPVVRLAARYEQWTGKGADAHLCVSQAMAIALAERWGIGGAQVFRDRPGEVFERASDAVRSSLAPRVLAEAGVSTANPYALVVIPTSWGRDEDFDLLLSAVDRCERLMDDHAAAHPARHLPAIVVLVTGRGPLRSRYEPLFEKRPARWVHVRAVWLPADEYGQLVGCADLGVCLHRSSSGLDLPMKISDLFGAAVPVCALDYGPCLAELVRDGENGLLFPTADELGSQMFDLLKDFPCASGLLERLRQGAAASAAVRWHEGWLVEAWPVLRGKGEA